MTTKTTWDLTDRVVLLPTGCGHPDDRDALDDVRCLIEQLGGEVAYALPPSEGYGTHGKAPSSATHEFVREGGVRNTTLPSFPAADLERLTEAAYADYTAFLAPLARPTWAPVVSPDASPGKGSRYFGTPWMPKAMKWPKQDGVPMRFVMQLDMASLPQGAAEGLLLFFHGRDYDSDPEYQSRIVVVDPSAPGGLRPTPRGCAETSALAVVGWRQAVDLPCVEDLGEIEGIGMFADFSESYGSTTCGMVMTRDRIEVTEKAALEASIPVLGHCFECDKLGGWPRWEQWNDTPEDSRGNPMEFLMQVGHEGLLLGDLRGDEIAWPTWGRGQIFRSRATGEFKYVWACD